MKITLFALISRSPSEADSLGALSALFFNARASTSPIVMETTEQLLPSEDDRED